MSVPTAIGAHAPRNDETHGAPLGGLTEIASSHPSFTKGDIVLASFHEARIAR
jgi:hypothetical protein